PDDVESADPVRRLAGGVWLLGERAAQGGNAAGASHRRGRSSTTSRGRRRDDCRGDTRGGADEAYLNHPASGAKAKRGGESTDTILCNCTDEQRREHMEDRPQMDPSKPP